MVLVLALIGLAFSVYMLIYTVHFGFFTLRLADTHWESAPEFINSGNVFAWIIFFIVLLATVTAIRITWKVITIPVGLLYVALAQISVRLFLVGYALGFVVKIVLLSFATYYFIQFTTQFTELNSTFNDGNWLAIIFIFLAFLGMTMPSPNNSEED